MGIMNLRRRHHPASQTAATTPLAMALEPRIMLDAAAVATGAEAVDQAQTAEAQGAVEADEALPQTEENAPATKEVVFIDQGIDDWQSLAEAVSNGADVVTLDANTDGLTQMLAWAEGKGGYDAIHVLSHGSEASVRLGSLQLDGAAVAGRADDLAALGTILAQDGDILLYGCSVASDTGQAFIDDLAAATGADIAASDDATGAPALGGDWTLETVSGEVETAALYDGAALPAYGGLLAQEILSFDGEGFNAGDEVDDATYTIQGTTVEIYLADASGNKLPSFSSGGASLFYDDAARSFSTDPNVIGDGGALISYSNNTTDGWPTDTITLVIKSTDGSNFKFTSFKAHDRGFTAYGSFLTITAYDDGSATGSENTVLNSDSAPWHSNVILSDAAFENTDEVRITMNTSHPDYDPTYPGLRLVIDSLVFDSAVSPSANPSLDSATGTDPTFTENGGATSALFSGVTVSTNDSGQDFTGMTLEVTNATNADSLIVGGTTINLTNGTSGALTSGSYSVSVSGGTATITLSGMNHSEAAMASLIEGIKFTNSSEAPSTANRTVTITQLIDSGSGNNTVATNAQSTVTVVAQNDAPTASGVPADVTVTEDVASNLDLSAMDLTDADGSDTLDLVLTASAGTLAATSGGGVTVTGSGTGTLTLSGTAANLNTFLNTASNVKYTGAANVNGNDAATLTLTVNDNAGSGDVSLGTVNIDITAVNDAPEISGSAQTPSINDTGTATPFSSLSVTDVEGTGTFTLSITYTGANGTLSGTGLSGSAGNYVLSGSSPAELTSRLQALVFTPTANQVTPGQTVTTTFSLTPGDGTDNGTAHTATTVTTTSVNDAPTLGQPANAVVNDTAANDSFSDVTGTLSGSDADTGQTLTYGIDGGTSGSFGGYDVRKVGTYGTLLVNSSTGAYAFVPDNAAVNALSSAQTETFDVTVGDGTDSATKTLTVELNGTNDTPTVHLDGGSTNSNVSFSAGGGAVSITGASAPIVDLDSGDQIESLTVTLTNPSDGAAEGLSLTSAAQTALTTAGLTLSAYDSGTGTLTVSGAAAASVYQTVLQGIVYDNSAPATGAGAITTGARTITVTVNDGAATSATATATVDVVTAPIVDLNGGGGGTGVTVGYTENQGWADVAGAATVADPDGDQIDQMIITLTPQDGAAESIRLSGGERTVNGITVTYDSATQITLNGAADASDYQALLRELQYRTTSDAPGGTARTITVQSRDIGGNTGAAATATINVTATNDAPTAANLTQTATYTEDPGSAVPLFPAPVTVGDVDGNTLTATVTLADKSFGSLAGGGGTYDAATGTWTISDTAATVQAALNALEFTPVANLDRDTTAAVSISDGMAPALAGIVTLDVTGVNDAPDISPATATKTVEENGAVTFSAGDFGFTDPDTGDTLHSITVDPPTAGTLFLDSNGDGTLSGGESAITTTTTVTSADIAKLTFRPPADTNGAGYAAFSWTVSDGTASSATSGTMTIDVTPAPEDTTAHLPDPPPQTGLESDEDDETAAAGDDTTGRNMALAGLTRGQTTSDPSTGVDTMAIVHNAVTGNDTVLSRFYDAALRTGGAFGGNSGGGFDDLLNGGDDFDAGRAPDDRGAPDAGDDTPQSPGTGTDPDGVDGDSQVPEGDSPDGNGPAEDMKNTGEAPALDAAAEGRPGFARQLAAAAQADDAARVRLAAALNHLQRTNAA